MSDTVARNERQYDVRYISCKSCQHPIYDDSKSFTGAVFQVNRKSKDIYLVSLNRLGICKV